MTNDEIINRLRQVMQRSPVTGADWSTVTAASEIRSLGFDSLTILDLIYDIQQEFGVEFPAEDVAGIRTVGELAAFIGNKASA